jgi:hypothetical protein
MKYFRYTIEDDLVKSTEGEVNEVPAGFIECEEGFGPDSLYYKIVDTNVTEVIGEAFHEDAARRRVEDFLSRLNAHLL